MGTLGNPKIWVPYINPKDCSQGFCSISCPQWCYLIFPPPPPSSFPFPLDSSSSSSSSTGLSPVMITIIGVLGSALLLISYYAILSKYCGDSEASRNLENHQSSHEDDDEEVEDDHDHNNPSEHEPWVITRVGLDEALIKSITLVKYNKGDGLVGSGDCSVCLGEFQDDEALRLLPKCSHAFHVECIDTWLRSHLNCPLCRAPIFSTTQSPPPPQQPPPSPPLVVDSNNNNNNLHPQDHEPLTQTQIANEQEDGNNRSLPKIPFQGSRDHGLHEGVQGHKIRRSISMDHCHETRVSISDALRFDSKEGAGESSNSSNGGSTSVINGNGVLDCVMNSVGMKRSFSSGRFLFMSKHGRGRNAIIPL